MLLPRLDTAVYWAPHYRDTRLVEVLAWIVGMLRRRRSSVTTVRLRGEDDKLPVATLIAQLVVLALAIIYVVFAIVGKPSWWVSILVCPVVMAVALLILAWSGYCGLQAMLRCLVVFIPTVIPTVVLTFVAAGIGIACIEDKCLRAVLYILVVLLGAPFVVVPVVATIWGGKFLAMSLGDVARYFSTSPAVIRENDSIRAQARKLIEELHDLTVADVSQDAQKRFRYSRIIVVGHSLGSVIAYDAVHSAWRARHNDIPVPSRRFNSTQQRELLKELESAFYEPKVQDGAPAPRPEEAKRWIVSDLITLACPLAHAEVTLARSPEDLEKRFAAGELLSSNPPEPPFPGNDYEGEDREELGLYLRRSSNSTRRLYHRTLFAFTHWTNVWISHDIVGGPLPYPTSPGSKKWNSFGDMVKNEPCGGSNWMWNMIFQYPHSSYFTLSERSKVKDPSKKSLEAIRNIVDPSRRDK
jgi:hypothetical protein